MMGSTGSALASTGVAALLVAAAFIVSNDYYLYVMFMAGVYFLCAAGMNVLAGYAGQKSLGQAGLFAVGAYTVALLTTRWQVSPALALAAAPAFAAVAGVLIALPSLRVKGPSLALVTLAFGVVVEKIVTEWTDFFGGAQGVYGIVPLGLQSEVFSLRDWVILVVILGLVTHLLLAHALKGRFGRALLALQADEIAARCAGISVYRYKILAFVVAAATCGLAGGLVAQQNQYFNSDFVTFHLSIFILLLVLLGGAGTLYGPVAGAVVLTLTDVFLARWPFVQHFIYGAMLLFALYLMPQGIVGAVRNLLGRRPSTTPGGLGEAPRQPPARARMPVSTEPLLECREIGKAFGGVVTADKVTLSLHGGRIQALIGPNGAGKSTLINILTGIIRADSGQILFAGRDVTRARAHDLASAGIARTFQNLRLFGEMSVLDNVLVGAHSRADAGAAAREKAMAVLDFVGLAHEAGSRAGSLPYGLQRRIELARALAAEPTLLLLDEPAAGLNPQETVELGQLIRRIGESGLSILLIEHDMTLVMEISDEVFVLDRGRIIAHGTPAMIQSDQHVIAAYLGPDDALAALMVERAAEEAQSC
jgi:branched-chain amino acid transport system permease protein